MHDLLKKDQEMLFITRQNEMLIKKKDKLIVSQRNQLLLLKNANEEHSRLLRDALERNLLLRRIIEEKDKQLLKYSPYGTSL